MSMLRANLSPIIYTIRCLYGFVEILSPNLWHLQNFVPLRACLEFSFRRKISSFFDDTSLKNACVALAMLTFFALSHQKIDAFFTRNQNSKQALNHVPYGKELP